MPNWKYGSTVEFIFSCLKFRFCLSIVSLPSKVRLDPYVTTKLHGTSTCKSHAVTLCMYFYHFITIGASGNLKKKINTQFRYQIIVIISRLYSNRVIWIAVHAMPTAWCELACLERAFRAWHDCTHMRQFSVVLVKWLSTLAPCTWIWYSVSDTRTLVLSTV